MRRGHKKKRKHAMTFYGTRETSGRRRVNMLRTLTVLSHVAAIIGTIALIVDALHRW
jgi:hypothetical protein